MRYDFNNPDRYYFRVTEVESSRVVYGSPVSVSLLT